MATIHLPPDFKEFFRYLNSHKVEYLLVGGYAVGYYGFPRATMDIDIWVAKTVENVRKTVSALEDFGFGGEILNENIFLQGDKIIRMGLPPMRIEILTSISGVNFDDAYSKRIYDQLDGVDVCLISLEDLKVNKAAAGRHKDLTDLEQLP